MYYFLYLYFWVAFNLFTPLFSFTPIYPLTLVLGFVESNNHRFQLAKVGFHKVGGYYSCHFCPFLLHHNYQSVVAHSSSKRWLGVSGARMGNPMSNSLVILWLLPLNPVNIFIEIKKSFVDFGNMSEFCIMLGALVRNRVG